MCAPSFSTSTLFFYNLLQNRPQKNHLVAAIDIVFAAVALLHILRRVSSFHRIYRISRDFPDGSKLRLLHSVLPILFSSHTFVFILCFCQMIFIQLFLAAAYVLVVFVIVTSAFPLFHIGLLNSIAPCASGISTVLPTASFDTVPFSFVASTFITYVTFCSKFSIV